MFNGESVIAVIPARGGSKGIPRKNIRLADGKPLIAWTIEAANKSKFIDRVILSTDNEEIIKCAKSLACEVPFVRPDNLASDTASSVDVVEHAMMNILPCYEWIALLQPTSPLRNSDDIDACIKLCIGEGFDSCVSVTKVDKSPYWMYSIEKDSGALQPIMGCIDQSPERRQDAQDIYVLNGAIYLIKREVFLKVKKFLTDNSTAYIMPYSRSLDIDIEEDFLRFERIIGVDK